MTTDPWILSSEDVPPEGPPLPPAASARWGTTRLHIGRNSTLSAGVGSGGRWARAVRGDQLVAFSLPEGHLRRWSQLRHPVTHVVHLPDSDRSLLVAQARDPNLLWVLEWTTTPEGEALRELFHLPDKVDAFAATPDGKQAVLRLEVRATGENRFRLRHLDLETGQVGPRVQDSWGEVLTMSLSRDGSRMARLRRTRDQYSQFDPPEVETFLEAFGLPSLTRAYQWPTPGRLGACWLSDDGAAIFLEVDDEVTVTALEGDDPVRPVAAPATATLGSLAEGLPPVDRVEPRGLFGAALSPDGRFLATSQRVFDLKTGRAAALEDPGDSLATMGFVDGGATVLRVDWTHSLAGFDPLTGSARGPLEMEGGRLLKGTHALSPDGAWAAFGGARRGNDASSSTLALVDLVQGRRRALLTVPCERVQQLEFSPDSAWLLALGTAGDTRAFAWDLASLQRRVLPELLFVPGVQTRGASVLYPGPRLDHLVGTLRIRVGVRIFDPETGEHLAGFDDLDFPVTGPATSPCGRWLGLLRRGGGSALVDLRDHRIAAELEGHRGRTEWVRFTPCGEHLLTAGEDGTFLRWDLDRVLGRGAAKG